MKLYVEDANVHYRVRQSWLNDFMLCPERSRLAITLPQWRSGSDATAIGTGIHAAIEWAMRNHEDIPDVDLEELKDVATKHVLDELEKPIKLTKISDDEEVMMASVDAMIEGWHRDIAPMVEWGGHSEYQFEIDTGLVSANNVPILLTGTMDYISPSGEIWDWKTSTRTYTPADKQARAIQPTFYCYAAEKLGLSDGTMSFFYGVMVRKPQIKTQVVEIVREQAHYDWMLRQLESATRMATTMGIDHSWPMNDQGHLCSSTWCDYWSICKGASLP